MSAATPTPLVCSDGSLVWFDTLECVGCLTCAVFADCVATWAQDAKIPAPK